MGSEGSGGPEGWNGGGSGLWIVSVPDLEFLGQGSNHRRGYPTMAYCCYCCYCYCPFSLFASLFIHSIDVVSVLRGVVNEAQLLQ